MNITPISKNTVINKQRSHNISFKAYVFKPNGSYSLANINPLKKPFDKVIELSLKFAKRRVHPISETLAPFTKEVNLTAYKNKKSFSYAWDINPADRKKYVLFLHGTGQNITNLQPTYQQIAEKTNYAVYVPEFRGFGKNPSYPISSRNLLEDATVALKYLLDRGIKKEDICVVGHSLGCQVGTELAIKNKGLKELILISPIDSFRENMNFDQSFKNNVPSYLLKLCKSSNFLNRPFDKFYGIGKIIKKVEAPIDIIHAKNDSLVKVVSAQEIAKKCKNFRTLNILAEGSHKIDNVKNEQLINILNSI